MESLKGLRAVTLSCLSDRVPRPFSEIASRVRSRWGQVSDRQVYRTLAWLQDAGLVTRADETRTSDYLAVKIEVYRPTRDDMAVATW
jgi:DNA-binding PadR family transcriptional regulator